MDSPRNRFLPGRIRGKLLLAFGVGITVLFVLMGTIIHLGLPFGLFQGEYRIRERRAIDRLTVIADIKKSAIVQWVEGKRGDLAACALDPRLAAYVASLPPTAPAAGSRNVPDSVASRNLLEWLSSVKEIRHLGGISIIDPATGTCLLSTETSEAGHKDSCFAGLFRGEGDWIEKVAFTGSEKGDRTMFLIGRRIDSSLPGEGRPALSAALVFQVDMEDSGLLEILHTPDLLGESGEIELFDMQKMLLAPLKYPLSDGTGARPLSYKMLTESSDYAIWGNEIVLRTVDYRGVPVIAAVRHYRVTQDFGLGMIVKQDERELLAPFRKSVLTSVAIVFTGMVVLIAILAFMTRRLLQPLERLTETVRRIEAGEIGARARIESGDEIGELSKNFDAMADRIAEWYDALEETVLQRTANLQDANRQLSHAKEYTESLIQAANAIIVGLDAGGCVTLMNRTAEEATGYRLHELSGKDWVETLVPTGLRDDARKGLESVFRGKSGNFETPIVAKEGITRIISWRNSPLSEQGAVVGAIVFGIDITEHRRLEQHLLEARKMEAVGRLAGGVAHDFNNQLTVILGYLELVLSRLSPDDRNRDHLQQVMKAAESARDLTGQLLAFSRRQVVSPRPVDLNALIAGIEKNLVRLIGEDILQTFRPCEEPWTILIDPNQLEQLVVNLAVNARDAMPEGGRLTIETRNVSLGDPFFSGNFDAPPGDYLELRVEDTGVGMGAETLAHIFEPFFTTKEIGKGTGLGLATVYGIVNQNNGYIDVRSEPGAGTCFRVLFPRIARVEGASPENPEPEETFAGSGVILLVEDEEPVRLLTTRMLESMGYTVLVANSPQEAIALCATNGRRIDLVLTDVIMPGMSGRELSGRVKALRPDLAVLFMSGYTADIVARKGILDGETHFLQKPFDRITLARQLRKLLPDSPRSGG